MATRLKKLKLTELSLVDNPANADSVVTLAKRYDEATTEAVDKGGKKMFADLRVSTNLWPTIDALSQSIRSIIEDDEVEEKKPLIEETIEQFREEIAGMVKKSDEGAEDEDEMLDDLDDDLDDELDGVLDDLDDDEDDEEAGKNVKPHDNGSTTREDTMSKNATEQTPEDVIKSLPESVRKMVEDAQNVAKAAQEQVQKLTDAAEQAKAVALAKSYLGTVPGDANLIGSLLRKASDDEKEALQSVLKAAATAADEAKLFKAVGDSGADVTDETVKLNKRVGELMAANTKLTKAQAVAAALDEDPSLYEASLA